MTTGVDRIMSGAESSLRLKRQAKIEAWRDGAALRWLGVRSTSAYVDVAECHDVLESFIRMRKERRSAST